MSDKVLVVGATGLVGQEVVKALVERGVSVKAASHSGKVSAGAEATLLDLHRPETFEDALTGVDRVFLLVPTESLTAADDMVLPFVERLKTAGIRRLVCMTGMTANRPGVPMYQIEVAVRKSGIPYTLLRPNWFAQNFAPGYYLESIYRSGGIFLPVGDAKTSFVDTRDIGEVAAVALTEDGHDGREYTLTGPEALDYYEACRILSEVADREIHYTPISDDQMRDALRQKELPADSIEELIRLYRITREGACALVSGDVELVLGRPPISFEEFARDHADILAPAPV